MKRIGRALTAICAVTAALGLAACGPSQEEQMAAQRAADFAALETAKTELDGLRSELAALEADLEAKSAADAAGGSEEAEEAVAGPSAEELKAQVEQKRATVDEKANEYVGAVVKFINDDPPVVGEPLTETQIAAIRLKSAEDMLVAQDHIQRGGDYRTAIRIYEDALKADPDNEDLKAAIAEAEANRFIGQEKFSAVKNKMTESEVRAALGPVYYRNIRDYPEQERRAWFYAKNEEGDAAAVYFQKDKKSGEYRVYKSDFNAVKAGESV